MTLVSRRNRGQPIHVGTEEVNGTPVHFHLERDRQLLFHTDDGHSLLAFGIPVSVHGTAKLKPGFDIHSVDVVLAPPSFDVYGRAAPFDEGDRDRALEQAVGKMVSAAAERLLRRDMRIVAAAWLDLADDHALERMSYRRHCADKLDAKGEDFNWREEDFLQDQVRMAEREAASVDEEAYAHSWLFESRPGYVVLCEGKPVDRGETRFREDRGTGWLQRHVFKHLSAAHAFADELSREDVEVQRIRVVEGWPYAVTQEGLAKPEWSFDEPVLTGTLEAKP